MVLDPLGDICDHNLVGASLELLWDKLELETLDIQEALLSAFLDHHDVVGLVNWVLDPLLFDRCLLFTFCWRILRDGFAINRIES